MRKYLNIRKDMTIKEKTRRNSFNLVFDTMRERKVFNQAEVMQYFLRQTDFETCGGYVLTYDEALNYYNEMIKTYN